MTDRPSETSTKEFTDSNNAWHIGQRLDLLADTAKEIEWYVASTTKYAGLLGKFAIKLEEVPASGFTCTVLRAGKEIYSTSFETLSESANAAKKFIDSIN